MDHLFPLQALSAINMPTSPRTKQLINRATSYNIFTNVSVMIENKRVWAYEILPLSVWEQILHNPRPHRPTSPAHPRASEHPMTMSLHGQLPHHHWSVQKIPQTQPISSVASTGFSQMETCFRPHKHASQKSLSTSMFPTASHHHTTCSCFTHSALCAWSLLEPHFTSVKKCRSSTFMSLFPRALCMFNQRIACLQNNFNIGHLYACICVQIAPADLDFRPIIKI